MATDNNNNWIPNIEFNTEAGSLYLSGRSLPEDPKQVFEPLLLQAKEYCLSPATNTNIKVELEYINTASVQWLYNVLIQFKQLFINKNQIDITFTCPDDDMVTTAHNIKSRLDVPIQIVKTAP